MYKLIKDFKDALVAKTSQDPTDFKSAFDTITSSDDVFVTTLVEKLGVESTEASK